MTYRGNSTHFQRTIFIFTSPDAQCHWLVDRARIIAKAWFLMVAACFSHPSPFRGSPLAVTFGPLEIVRAKKLPPSTPVLGRCEYGRNRKVREESRLARHSPVLHASRSTTPNPLSGSGLPTPSAITNRLFGLLLLRTETRGRGRLEGDLQPCVSHLYRAIETQTRGALTAAAHAELEVGAAARERAWRR